jgi:hypothetical protein
LADLKRYRDSSHPPVAGVHFQNRQGFQQEVEQLLQGNDQIRPFVNFLMIIVVDSLIKVKVF